MPDLTDPSFETTGGSSRRTVLKGAAWTAPAIVVATAVPAFAASVTKVSIVPASGIPIASTPVGGNPGITVDVDVVVDADSGALEALTVVFSATLAGGATFGGGTMGTAPNFTPAVVTGGDTTKNFEFVYLGPVPIEPGSVIDFKPTISSQLVNGGNGTFIITPNPTPAGTVTSGTGSF